MQPELCSDCGRVIRISEIALIHGESVLCAHCDLKHRLGCPDLHFCTRCHSLISVKQTPWVIDDQIVCEPCASRPVVDLSNPADAAGSEANPTPQEQEEDQDMEAVHQTARLLMAAWLTRTEEPAGDPTAADMAGVAGL